MSCAYYWDSDYCPHCRRGFRTIIGTSAVGWVFALQLYPERVILTLEDWEQAWRTTTGVIRDEYNVEIPWPEMSRRIRERAALEDWGHKTTAWAGRYASEADFHRENGSERAPHGLLRERLGASGRRVARGGPTWDCYTEHTWGEV